MANEIIQGDSGTVLSLTIQDDSQIVDLTNATVEVAIKFKATGILKQATITDAVNGICEITLDETDIPHEGVYSFQATVKFADGKKFSSNIQRFTVLKKLNYTPNVGGGNSDIGGSTTNGNIIINGLEVKVYDDSAIRSDINNLKQSKHTHSNLESLERLGVNSNSKLTIDGIELVTGGTGGSSVSDSVTNGNIVVNGTEVKVYDDTSIQQSLNDKANTSDLHSHTNKSMLDQITAAFTTELKTKLEALNGILVYPTVTDLQSAFPNGTDQPVWIASDKAWYYWEAASDTTAPAVTANPTEGTYTSTQSVTLSANESATIYYTIDGSTPTTSSTVYSSAILVSATTTLKFFARDTAGNSSAVQTVNYTINIADTTAPNEVTNLTTSGITATSINLSWTASISSDIASYEVYNGSTLLGTTENTTYSVSGLTASTQYTFTVKAKDTSGNVSTGVSTVANTTAEVDTTPPADVTNLTASNITSSTVDLSWTPSASSDVASYDIYNGVDFFINVTGTTYQVTGLAASTSYTFNVIAKDGAGNKSVGVSVTITTSNSVATQPYVTDGLQIYYDFTKYTTTPTTIDDDSGNGNYGTLYGYSGNSESGIVNGELIGDGIGDYITIPHKSNLKTYPFTIEFYARFKNRAVTPPSTNRMFDVRYGSGTGNGVNLYANNESHANPSVIGLDGSLGSPSYTTSLNVYDDVYRHIIVVWDSTVQKVYVNGSLLATNNQSSTTLGDRTLYLFAAGNTTGDSMSHGCKLFRFYNKALSTTEITQNYNDAIGV